MEEISGFKEIAPYLENPLVLIGFVLLLFFGVHRALLKAGILPPLTPHTGSKVVQSFLRYGFVIALVIIILGFGFAFYKAHLAHDAIKTKGETARLEGLAEVAKGYCQRTEKIALEETARREVVHACNRAIIALTQIRVPEAGKEDALARLEKGDAQGAKTLFQAILERKAAEGQATNLEAADAARHLGALAFYDNTKEALAGYRKAVKLDPGNPEGWNQLGHLLFRTGDLKDAEAVYGKVKAIAEARNDRQWLATVYGSLGVVYWARGDLTQAEVMIKKALAIDEALGRKEGIADSYGNLGGIYLTRGDLTQAETMQKMALAIFEELGNKEGIANSYMNLGNIYRVRGDMAQAETMQKKGLAIFEELGSKKGVAKAYINLGSIYWVRGDMAQAETMYRKSLAISEAQGYKQVTALAYDNMGNVYAIHGDMTQAKEMFQKSLLIWRELGATIRIRDIERKILVTEKLNMSIPVKEALNKSLDLR